ncbi:MAG: hypothetical protein JJ908_05880 [Rhizobiales bacterium]|nr:hypothetical protein [Hyphomicrobiales bacterium]MBO6697865.1 hypothetical protein [Hyphomicrobiales bacterium]MBO6735881.1 hypothetical protein [Hyphomicrobiales bacterium]MBO6913892.1 hypothetical protein [Hyphomicrobiales bacterium]MBO6955595.1 hypothetical protein [Hyphomicrobiales bacterium]
MSENSQNHDRDSRITPPPLPPHNRPSSDNALPPWQPLLILGAALAAGLFVFVQETRVFGESCYHIGDITMQTTCLDREVYMGAWVVAVGLVGLGAIGAIKESTRGSTRLPPDR